MLFYYYNFNFTFYIILNIIDDITYDMIIYKLYNLLFENICVINYRTNLKNINQISENICL